MDIIKLFADGFPLTTQRLEFLQETYGKAFANLSTILGEGNVIVDGVKSENGRLTDGVIKLANGEILPFEDSAFNNRIAVFETVNEVPYNIDEDNDGNLDLKVADVVRIARCAASGGVDATTYSTYTRVGNLQTINLPLGSIIPFDGNVNDLPYGWEVYNMADTFLMGAGGTHSLNGAGGTNSLTIQRANLPNFNMSGSSGSGGGHSHGYRDGYYIESFPAGNDRQDQFASYGSESVGTGFRGSGGSDVDNTHIWYKNRTTDYQSSHTHSFSVNSGGSGTAVDNRPKFKALNFIKKVAI